MSGNVPRPSPYRAFARSLVDRLGGGIAQSQQDLSGSMWLSSIKLAQGLLEGIKTEVRIATGTIDTVKECSEVDELRAILHEVEIQYLLSRHRCHGWTHSTGFAIRFNLRLGRKEDRPAKERRWRRKPRSRMTSSKLDPESFATFVPSRDTTSTESFSAPTGLHFRDASTTLLCDQRRWLCKSFLKEVKRLALDVRNAQHCSVMAGREHDRLWIAHLFL